MRLDKDQSKQKTSYEIQIWEQKNDQEFVCSDVKHLDGVPLPYICQANCIQEGMNKIYFFNGQSDEVFIFYE